MSNGKNASKHYGKEWWGKRPLSGISSGGNYMRFWKRLLHKLERKQGELEIDNFNKENNQKGDYND